MIKISFLGDMMCEPRLLKAAVTSEGLYDFSGVFKNVRPLLERSDFVIGNLETPLAGPEAGYSDSLFRFNSPDSFARAAFEAGVGLMLTANNHCLDRELDGLKKTVQALDGMGIPHAGTFLDPAGRGNTCFTTGGKRFAVISYTYGTNYADNRLLLSGEEQGCVNLLRPQTESYFVPQRERTSFYERAVRKATDRIRGEKRFAVRKLLGVPVSRPHEDDNLKQDTAAPYMERLFADIEKAKNEADFILFCPHIGGQFNDRPGIYSKYVFTEAVNKGVHAIVASHPHVVQEARLIGDTPCFFSLGNFSMSPNSGYLLHDYLPDYGIAAHLYFDENGVAKTAFSILKIIEKDLLTVVPADVYAHECRKDELGRLSSDVRLVYQRVTGKTLSEDVFREEYLIG